MTIDTPANATKVKDLDSYIDEVGDDLIIGATAELLFVLLPLLVLSIIFEFRGHASNILASPEWSFAASILFGQALIRLVRTISEHGRFRTERIGLLSAIILVIGLVPSLVVLSMFLINEPQEPTLLMISSQLVMFAFSIFCYIFCAMAPANALGRRKFAAAQARLAEKPTVA